MIKRSLGCLLVIVVFLVVATWPLAKMLWAMAVAMVGVASAHIAMYDTTDGVVIEATDLNPNMVFPRNVRVEYEYDGEDYVGFTRLTPLPRLAKTMEVGDTVKVYVCREDPSKMKLVMTDTSDCPVPERQDSESLAD